MTELSLELRNVVEDLMTVLQGSTALVVADAADQEVTAGALAEECSLFGVTTYVLHDPRELDAYLAGERSPDGHALVVVVGDGAAAWAARLEGAHGVLASAARFIAVVLAEGDFPALARGAPELTSFARGLVVREPLDTRVDTSIADELAYMTSQTGRSPEEFVEAWRRGEIPDTWQNSVWLGLAWAATASRPSSTS